MAMARTFPDNPANDNMLVGGVLWMAETLRRHAKNKGARLQLWSARLSITHALFTDDGNGTKHIQ